MTQYRRSKGTTVTVQRTRAEITKLFDSLKDPLTGKGIRYGFDNDESSVFFQYGGIPVKLRVDPLARFKALKAERKRTPYGGWETLQKQAEREAWRNLLDWLKISITLMQDEQFRFVDLFLPFITVKGGLSFADHVLAQDETLKSISGGRLALPE